MAEYAMAEDEMAEDAMADAAIGSGISKAPSGRGQASTPDTQTTSAWPPSVTYVTTEEVQGLILRWKPRDLGGGLENASDSAVSRVEAQSSAHRSLKPESYFRLLHLRPGPFDGPVFGWFSMENLNSALPRYTALSYTWANASGDTSLSSVVMIQPTPGSTSLYDADLLEVTENCETALRRLRAAGHLTVWVDAVCVNQRSTRERTYQVGLMSRIYASATRVFIYTGEDDADRGQSGEAVLRMLSERGMADLDMRDGASDEADDGAMIDMFFQRPYFWRKWIIQEIALAQEATLACGRVELPWGLISLQASASDAGAVPVVHERATLSSIAQNRKLKFLAPSANPPPWLSSLGRLGSRSPTELVKLLYETRRCLCSDDRDRIFSLLGLQKDPDAPDALRPDYTLNVRDTFVGFAAWVIEKLGPESLLLYRQNSLGQGQEKTRVGLRMPSWTPFWDKDTVRQASESTIRSWFPTKRLPPSEGLSSMFLDQYVILGPRELWPSSDPTSSSHSEHQTIVVHAETGSLVVKQCRLLRLGTYTDTFHPCLSDLEPETEEQRSASTHRTRQIWRFFLSLDAEQHVNPVQEAVGFRSSDVFAAIPGLEVLLHLRPTSHNSYLLLATGLLALRPPEPALGDPLSEDSLDLSPLLTYSERTLNDFLKLFLWLSILETQALSWSGKRLKGILDRPSRISDIFGNPSHQELEPFKVREVPVTPHTTRPVAVGPAEHTWRRLWSFEQGIDPVVRQLQAEPCHAGKQFEALVERRYWGENTRLLKTWIESTSQTPAWAREHCDLARQVAGELLGFDAEGAGAANDDVPCFTCALMEKCDTAAACKQWEISLINVLQHLFKLQSEPPVHLSDIDGRQEEKLTSLRLRCSEDEEVIITAQTITDVAGTISRASRDGSHRCGTWAPLDSALSYVKTATDTLWRLTSLAEEIARAPHGVLDIISRGDLHLERAGRAGPRWRSRPGDQRYGDPTARKLPLVVRGLFRDGPVIIE